MYEVKRRNVVMVIDLLVLAIVIAWNMENEFVVFAGYNNTGEVKTRCVDTEREALLKFKKDLADGHGLLSSWGSEKSECCTWIGVGCSNTTGHVIALLLPGRWSGNAYYYLGAVNISASLIQLRHLEALDLSGNNFAWSKVPDFICSMTQLRHLNLSRSMLSQTIPPRIQNLANLETLDLSFNEFSGTVTPQIGYLTKLTTLDLSHNHFSGTVTPQIGNLANLEKIDLSSNLFYGIIPPQLWSLPNLKDIDLSENNLTSISKIHDPLPSATLRSLILRNNKLKSLPQGVWRLTKLEKLIVSFNSLEGTITETNLTDLQSLKILDISYNSLTLDIKPDWAPPFRLDAITLAGCNMISSDFPSWLQTQSNLSWIDLSLTNISGEVPDWFWTSLSSPQIQYLNISHNQLSGTLPQYFSSNFLQTIDVSCNKFVGHMPLFPPSTRSIFLSQNMLSGSISFICSIPSLVIFLDLSNNQLAGELPDCWENTTQLSVLSLANNNFSGEIPPSLGSLSNLVTLHLGNNTLSGELPSTLKNCYYLRLLDIGDNMISGNIPTWLGKYPTWLEENIPTWLGEHSAKMTYLIFRNNRFHGGIPEQMCRLSRIQVLDLSGNSISGRIPPCLFTNLTDLNGTHITSYTVRLGLRYDATGELLHDAEYIDNAIVSWKITSGKILHHDTEYIDYVIVSWKHKESEYRKTLKFLKHIDLSRNRLVGSIPNSSLSGLVSLNLSRNRLTGSINPDIGKMENLQCLDLSSNRLSGVIPIRIVNLHFLSVVDLSNNKLSGKIPSSTQLQSFPVSAYAGNPELCGLPLHQCPWDSPNLSTNNEVGAVGEAGFFSLPFCKEVSVSIILGFIVGFWWVVGSLIVKESWRKAFYNFWEDVGDWFWVRATIFWRKLRRSIN